jgi:hypothetical protein
MTISCELIVSPLEGVVHDDEVTRAWPLPLNAADLLV